MRKRWTSLFLFWMGVSFGLAAAESKPLRVKHLPERPRSGDLVRITITGGRASDPKFSELQLQYQIVEPGRYIERSDAAYPRNWTSVPSQRGDEGSLFAEIPASIQQHRRLIRYRLMERDRMVAPAPDDRQPNFAYFVYDGVPDWRAAIYPKSDSPSLRTPTTYPGSLLGSVQVYHFIAKQASVEKTTWYEPSDIWNPKSRHEYKYTGTLVIDGVVYDHVRFRARGGEWRHAMGKNMWKFDFNRGHHLQARDNFGRPYRTKWEKLNLGACIQQGNYECRGEHGLFEAVTYKLFNLAGVPAPHTHYVHLRIIDEVEESPANQYKGDFWGLYLATEEIDGNFLEEHQMPDGNVYKWDFGQPKPEHFAERGPTNGQDILEFISSYRRSQPDEWWRQNVDLERYFNYRSIVECVHHYDIGAGKNYFYYFQPTTRQWIVLPWDVDLTWKDDMYGTGLEPFSRAGVLRRPQFHIEYQNRLREIRDLLFNPEQTGALIDEFAAVVSDPSGGASFVDADRAKWDYHPIMASRWVEPRKAGQGKFYQGPVMKTFRGMMDEMKRYIVNRGRWCDSALLRDRPVPPTPEVSAAGALDFKAATLSFQADSGRGDAAATKMQWRLGEVSVAAVTKPTTPRPYEIEALWEGAGSNRVAIPSSPLKAGHTYRVRARACDENGRCSHWSKPVQFEVK
jgi:hypothetical protein